MDTYIYLDNERFLDKKKKERPVMCKNKNMYSLDIQNILSKRKRIQG